MLIHGYNAYLMVYYVQKKVGEEEAGVVEEGVGDAVVEGEEEEEEAEVGHEYDVNNTGCAPARINLLMKKYINSKLGQRIGWSKINFIFLLD